MSVVDSRDIGATVERAVCERYPLERPDRERETWDAEVGAAITVEHGPPIADVGDRVEIKACSPTTADGRTGRWQIKRATLERRREEGDPFALCVYTPDSGELRAAEEISVERIGLVDAGTVAAVIESNGIGWSRCRGQDVAKLGWRHVFDGLEAPEGSR